MWTYEQRTGILRHNGQAIATGYAGRDTPEVMGKDNPTAQNVPDIGPLPQGLYTIGPLENVPGLGQDVMPLWPSPKNQMFGRSGFFIHDDLVNAPGTASHGCIVLYLPIRLSIARSGDNQLTVVSGE
jgi:hypothetical protein